MIHTNISHRVWRALPCHQAWRYASSIRTDDPDSQQLLQEASTLSRSLYRRCFRSIRHIRYGNEYDEAEFQRREEERLEKAVDQSQKDPRLSMLSMLPPVNRVDELRSRAEYYQQYTRENFVQESDCLDHPVLLAGHIDRFVYLLRRGDDHRKWLLQDMKFEDPCSAEEQQVAVQRLKGFEEKAKSMLIKHQSPTAEGASAVGDEDDDFWDDEEDDEEPHGLPEWYKNPRS